MNIVEGKYVKFICNSNDFPFYKGQEFEGRIDGFYENYNRILYVHFWPDGKDKSGVFISLKEAKNIR